MTQYFLLANPNINFVAKCLVVGLLGLYVFFTFIQIRQLNLMNKSFATPARSFFKLISYLHFITALGLLFLSLLLL